MKIFHETEDTLMGIAVGVILLLPLIFSLPEYNIVLTVSLLLLLLLNILDIFHSVKEFAGYKKACTVAILMNAVDITINLTFLSKIYSVNMPFIADKLVPLLTPLTIEIIAGYLIIGNLLYFFAHKKLE